MHLICLVLLTFCCGFVLDILQVWFTNAAVKGKAYVAANFSVVFAGLAALLIIFVVHNPWLMIPYLAGVWVGTVFGMRYRSEDDE